MLTRYRRLNRATIAKRLAFSEEKIRISANCNAHDDCWAVYVLAGNPGNPVKIGISRSPYRRRSGVQSGQWNELKIFGLRYFRDHAVASSVEKRAHEMAGEKRVRGEWFNLEPQEALDIVEFAALATNSEILGVVTAEMAAAVIGHKKV